VTRTTYNLQVGVPVPIFDRNQGGILKARGALVRAAREVDHARIDLTAKLADAFERYENNRLLLDYYKSQVLPDLVRTYRGVYERHQQLFEDVKFGDVVVAQQNLVGAINTYIQALGDQWDALTDLAGLLQVDSLAQLPMASEPPPELPPAPNAELRVLPATP
jgi:cobalt-zinc-cadmium efflux system outer membrane protein